MKDTTPHLLPIFALISLAFLLHTFPIQFHPFLPQLPLFIHTHCSLTFPFPHLCPFSHPHSIHLSPLTYLPTYISPLLSFPHLSYSISFTPSTLRYLHSPHTPYRILPPPQHLLLLRLLHSTLFTLPALLAVPASPYFPPHTPFLVPPLRTHLSYPIPYLPSYSTYLPPISTLHHLSS